MDRPSPFKWWHFEGEMILLCVRWYLRYALSYRGVEELTLERGTSARLTSPHAPISFGNTTHSPAGLSRWTFSALSPTYGRLHSPLS
jgi:hypothetical protein